MFCVWRSVCMCNCTRSYQIGQFLSILRHDLEQGVGVGLDSVIAKCMYFGLSFSRVGCDFRGLLADVFQESAVKLFTHSVTMATERYDLIGSCLCAQYLVCRFAVSMESYTLVLKSTHNTSSILVSLEVRAFFIWVSVLFFDWLWIDFVWLTFSCLGWCIEPTHLAAAVHTTRSLLQWYSGSI